MLLKDKILSLILNSTQIGTDEQRQKLGNFATALFNLATAADDYADQAAANENTDDDAETNIAGSLVDLAGNLVSLSQADALAQVRQLVADIYTDTDKELEKRGEALFNFTVDMRLASSDLVDLFPAAEPA